MGNIRTPMIEDRLYTFALRSANERREFTVEGVSLRFDASQRLVEFGDPRDQLPPVGLFNDQLLGVLAPAPLDVPGRTGKERASALGPLQVHGVDMSPDNIIDLVRRLADAA